MDAEKEAVVWRGGLGGGGGRGESGGRREERGAFLPLGTGLMRSRDTCKDPGTF